ARFPNHAGVGAAGKLGGGLSMAPANSVQHVGHAVHVRVVGGNFRFHLDQFGIGRLVGREVHTVNAVVVHDSTRLVACTRTVVAGVVDSLGNGVHQVAAHDAFGVGRGLHQQTAGNVRVGRDSLRRQADLANNGRALGGVSTFTDPVRGCAAGLLRHVNVAHQAAHCLRQARDGGAVSQ